MQNDWREFKIKMQIEGRVIRLKTSVKCGKKSPEEVLEFLSKQIVEQLSKHINL